MKGDFWERRLHPAGDGQRAWPLLGVVPAQRVGVTAWHLGRSFGGPGPLEVDPRCTCDKAPCGLIVYDPIRGCPNHPADATTRSAHRTETCPGRYQPRPAA